MVQVTVFHKRSRLFTNLFKYLHSRANLRENPSATTLKIVNDSMQGFVCIKLIDLQFGTQYIFTLFQDIFQNQ